MLAEIRMILQTRCHPDFFLRRNTALNYVKFAFYVISRIELLYQCRCVVGLFQYNAPLFLTRKLLFGANADSRRRKLLFIRAMYTESFRYQELLKISLLQTFYGL